MLGRLQQEQGRARQEDQGGAVAAQQGASSSGQGELCWAHGCPQEEEEEEWDDLAWGSPRSDADLVELSLRDWGLGEEAGGADPPLELSLRDWCQEAGGAASRANGAGQGRALDEGGPQEAAAAAHLPRGTAAGAAGMAAPGLEARLGDDRQPGPQPQPQPPTACHGAVQAGPAAGQALLHAPAVGGRGGGPPGEQVQLVGQARPPSGVQAAGAEGAQEGAAAAAAPQPPPTWTCSACAATNPKTVFWCEACDASKAQVGPAARRARRGAAAPSILQFVSRQPSPQADDACAAAQQQQQQQQSGAAGRESQGAGVDEDEEEDGISSGEDWSDPEEWDPAYEPTPRSRLLPGEDILECPQCGWLVRETLFEVRPGAAAPHGCGSGCLRCGRAGDRCVTLPNGRHTRCRRMSGGTSRSGRASRQTSSGICLRAVQGAVVDAAADDLVDKAEDRGAVGVAGATAQSAPPVGEGGAARSVRRTAWQAGRVASSPPCCLHFCKQLQSRLRLACDCDDCSFASQEERSGGWRDAGGEVDVNIAGRHRLAAHIFEVATG
jgi:hypothetical protein